MQASHPPTVWTLDSGHWSLVSVITSRRSQHWAAPELFVRDANNGAVLVQGTIFPFAAHIYNDSSMAAWSASLCAHPSVSWPHIWQHSCPNMLRLGPEKHGKLPHILGGCEHVIFRLFIAMILSGHMWTAFTVILWPMSLLVPSAPFKTMMILASASTGSAHRLGQEWFFAQGIKHSTLNESVCPVNISLNSNNFFIRQQLTSMYWLHGWNSKNFLSSEMLS